MLFAVDNNTEEIIVSDSPGRSNKINFVERIRREDNEILYNAVVTLTGLAGSSKFDVAIFKAMDKVCQMIYNKHKAVKQTSAASSVKSVISMD